MSETRGTSKEILKVIERFGTELKGKRFAIWGAGPRSRKPVDWLIDHDASVCIHRRECIQTSGHGFARGTGKSNPMITRESCHLHALQGAHALILFDDLEFYRGVEPSVLKWYSKDLEIIDLYDCLNLEWFKYSSFKIFRSETESLEDNSETDLVLSAG